MFFPSKYTFGRVSNVAVHAFRRERRTAVIAGAGPCSPDASAALPANADFFSTDAHYEVLADRISAALPDGRRFIIVTGDPVSPHLLSQALTKAAGPRHSVSNIRCGPELRGSKLPRTGPGVTPLSAGHGESGELGSAVPPAGLLLVFDDMDLLSSEQIREIHEAILLDKRMNSAAVLLARRGSLAQLEGPLLRFLEEDLGVHFRLQEVGPNESIAYLRHRLAQIQRHTRARRLSSGIFRGFLVLGFVMTASMVAIVLVHSLAEKVDGLPATAAEDTSSTAKASAPEPTANEAAHAISAQGTPTSEAAATAAAAPPAFTPAPPERAQEPMPRVTPNSPAPPTNGSRASAAEIASFLARGDKFLGIGDIASARLFYERAADAGDASAATRLGATFDPAFLGRIRVHGVFGDPAQALSWYRRARDLGDAAAGRGLQGLEKRHLAEPDAPTR